MNYVHTLRRVITLYVQFTRSVNKIIDNII